MQERRCKENDPILSEGSATPQSQQQEKLKSYKAYFIDGVVSILESYGTEVKVSVEQKCVL